MFKLKFFLRYHFPAILVAGVIFYLSSIPGLRFDSVSTTREIILRKGAHFVEYAILSFFLWRIFFSGQKLSARQSFWWAFILAAGYGASDEFHQTLVFARTGKIEDAFFDAFSALFALEIIYSFFLRKIKWRNVLVIFFSGLALFALGFCMILENNRLVTRHNLGKTTLLQEPEEEVSLEPSENKITGEENVADAEKEEDLPTEFQLGVPFTSQAPFFKWDVYHEEACEEASLVMLKYFLDKKELTSETAEKEIQALIAFQLNKYGFFEDSTAEETVRLGKDFYGLSNLSVVYDFSKEDLKKQVSRGFPVLVPAAGQMLGNPNFSGEGPPYHMLVIAGYEGKKIITNDPGTKRGEGYLYDEDILFEAIHDFTGDKKTIRSGRKAMIIFSL